MEENLICKSLKRLLKESGVYSQFRKNFYEQAKLRKSWCNQIYAHRFNKYIGDSLQDLCEEIDDKSLILNYSFDWTKTPQGHEFWAEITKRWVNNF